jgi:hypothetical protein
VISHDEAIKWCEENGATVSKDICYTIVRIKVDGLECGYGCETLEKAVWRHMVEQHRRDNAMTAEKAIEWCAAQNVVVEFLTIGGEPAVWIRHPNGTAGGGRTLIEAVQGCVRFSRPIG